MTRIFKSLAGVSLTLMLVAQTAHAAMPKSPEALRTLLDTQYNGDANAYAEQKQKDFRKMACKGRGDLIQALLDAGLDLVALSDKARYQVVSCSFERTQMEVVKLVLTPDTLSAFETYRYGEKYLSTLLGVAVYYDDYARTLVLLKNGVHAYLNDSAAGILTREEHLLLAAHEALKKRKGQSVRAFEEAGFGHIIAAARNRNNVEYVRQRIKSGSGKSGGGGLLRGIATIAAGTALGGTEGAVLSVLGAGDALDGADGSTSQPQRGGPLALATKRAPLDMALTAVAVPQRGLQVQKVLDNGVGALAGIQQGDVILRIAEIPVASRGSLYVATRKAFDAPEFDVEYLRAGKTFKTTFRPKEAMVSAATSKQTENAAVAAPTTSNMDTMLEDLERLGNLRDRGVLTDAEFQSMKEKILSGS